MTDDLRFELRERLERDVRERWNYGWSIRDLLTEWARRVQRAEDNAEAASQTARDVAATIGAWRKALERAETETREARREAEEERDARHRLWCLVQRLDPERTSKTLLSWECAAEGAEDPASMTFDYDEVHGLTAEGAGPHNAGTAQPDGNAFGERITPATEDNLLAWGRGLPRTGKEKDDLDLSPVAPPSAAAPTRVVARSDDGYQVPTLAEFDVLAAKVDALRALALALAQELAMTLRENRHVLVGTLPSAEKRSDCIRDLAKKVEGT